ncbi:MAG TPA: cytochrome b [Thiotrichaceae bacterium]|jgi:cytochrome b561|nr:cytochrome b [Thiotrichaceae bacterium]HIM07976.1 cytochrome b [Gammaproteobacteria bacterium]
MEIQRYNTTAVIIHWIMAILIIMMIGLGLYMTGLEKGSAERSWFFGLHKSLGLTLALLAIIRLVWKMRSISPALPDFVAPIQRKTAIATHHLLYLMMFIQPVSGYISSSFSGYKTKFWGIPLPHWGSKQPELNKLFTEIHEISAFCLTALLVLHICGVIYHMHRKETQLLRRMWFK